jgi:hypothetical protein
MGARMVSVIFILYSEYTSNGYEPVMLDFESLYVPPVYLTFHIK